MWCSQLCLAEENNIKRPKLTPKGSAVTTTSLISQGICQIHHFNEGLPEDCNENSCPFTSIGRPHKVQIGKILGKSIIWWSRQCPAEYVSVERPKIKPGGGKRNVVITKNLFFFGISGKSANFSWRQQPATPFCIFLHEP